MCKAYDERGGGHSQKEALKFLISLAQKVKAKE